MGKKFNKISRPEALVLVLAGLFALAALLWHGFLSPAPVAWTKQAQPLPEEELPAAPGILEGEVIDLNAASFSDLTRLPGVGPALAQAILDRREETGGFADVEGLLDVRGIGPGILEGLAPYVTAGGPAGEKGG